MSTTFCYFDLRTKHRMNFMYFFFFFFALYDQTRIWHALQPNWSTFTILLSCSFTPPSCDPPCCTRLIFVSTLGVFIRTQWTVRYPQSFYFFTMQFDLACPLGNSSFASFRGKQRFNRHWHCVSGSVAFQLHWHSWWYVQGLFYCFLPEPCHQHTLGWKLLRRLQWFRKMMPLHLSSLSLCKWQKDVVTQYILAWRLFLSQNLMYVCHSIWW